MDNPIRPLVFLFHKCELQEGTIDLHTDTHQYCDLGGDSSWVFGHSKLGIEELRQAGYFDKEHTGVELTHFSPRWQQEFGCGFTDAELCLNEDEWVRFFTVPSIRHYFALQLGYSLVDKEGVVHGNDIWFSMETNTRVRGDKNVAMYMVFGDRVCVADGPENENPIFLLKILMRHMMRCPTRTGAIDEDTTTFPDFIQSDVRTKHFWCYIAHSLTAAGFISHRGSDALYYGCSLELEGVLLIAFLEHMENFNKSPLFLKENSNAY